MLEQHSPDQCRAIASGIISKARQHLCDQTDMLAYSPRADAAMAFKPHGVPLKASGRRLLARERLQGFNPPDCDEMLQEGRGLRFGKRFRGDCVSWPQNIPGIEQTNCLFRKRA